MLDLIQSIDIGKENHWVLKLLKCPTHPLKDLILDYTPDGRQLFQTSYLYLGSSTETHNKNNICILHFHSSLNGPMKFMDMQNLDSYSEMPELHENEIAYLSLNISRSSVIDLSISDALTDWHIYEINNCKHFYITDETGFVKSYNTLYWGG